MLRLGAAGSVRAVGHGCADGAVHWVPKGCLLAVVLNKDSEVYCTRWKERGLAQALAHLQELLQKHTGLEVLRADPVLWGHSVTLNCCCVSVGTSSGAAWWMCCQ